MRTPETIFRDAAEGFGIEQSELCGFSRATPAVNARGAAIWAVRELRLLSYPRLGEYLNRDHTTIISAHARANELYAADNRFREICDALVDGKNIAAVNHQTLGEPSPSDHLYDRIVGLYALAAAERGCSREQAAFAMLNPRWAA